MKAVIQCGGKGTRLQTLHDGPPETAYACRIETSLGASTEMAAPKRRPRDIYITTGYLGHLIRSFCGDGNRWGIKINYTEENEPLGTIGPLSLLRDKTGFYVLGSEWRCA